MTFSVGQLQFIDSLQFMNSALQKLAANLQTENLKITSKWRTDKKLALLLQKGISLMDLDSYYESFDELQLPSKEDFYGTVSRKTISDNDNNHEQQI